MEFPEKMKANEVLTAATTRVNPVDMRSETSHKEVLKKKNDCRCSLATESRPGERKQKAGSNL